LLVLKKGLTIFTNSISNVQAIAGSENDVYILGGKIRSTSMASVGSWGVTETNDIHADMVFLGTDGFEGSEGPCTASYEESEIKKAMIKRARIKVIVSDSSKFDIAGLFKFCNWSDVDHFVTDSHISKKALTELSQNVNVITVNDND
jgi:DeoR/GlpR family transcriptional regulator of sugar metabolism